MSRMTKAHRALKTAFDEFSKALRRGDDAAYLIIEKALKQFQTGGGTYEQFEEFRNFQNQEYRLRRAKRLRRISMTEAQRALKTALEEFEKACLRGEGATYPLEEALQQFEEDGGTRKQYAEVNALIEAARMWDKQIHGNG